MDTISKRTLHRLGRISVVIAHIADYDADLSYLGEFSSYREPRNKDQKLVHRDSGSVLDHNGIWRDSKGRIAPVPEIYRYSRDYPYTFHDNGHECIKYALHDSRRLEDFNSGSLSCFGIQATVCFDGEEIGTDSVWGFESDTEDSYIALEERSIARQALGQARDYIGKILQAFAA